MDSFLVGLFTMGYWGIWLYRLVRIFERHGDKGVLFASHGIFILSTQRPKQNLQYGPLAIVLLYGNMFLMNIAPMIAVLMAIVITLLATIFSILKYGDDAYYEWLINLETKNT